MNKLITAACFMVAFSPLAMAQDKAKSADKPMAPAAESKASPSATQPKSTTSASDHKAHEGGKMSSSTARTKKEPSEKQLAHREKMKSCSKEASDKNMKGPERKTFMSSCLKG